LVPEEITEHTINTTTGKYNQTAMYQGRYNSGKAIHKARQRLKNYHQSLKNNQDPLYTKQMAKHHNKDGFWEKGNYNAKRMLEDTKFNPANQIWRKKYWPKGTWVDNLNPMMNEPYWHTTHSINKSNNWIFEHINDMKKRYDDGIITNDELTILIDELDKCIIQLDTKQT